jgi:hypothetical protein
LGKQKEITVNGKKKTARELTVAQIRELLDNVEGSGEAGIIDILYPDAIPAAAAAMSVGMSLTALEKLVPSDLDAIMEAATAVNPSLAALFERLAKLGTAALTAKPSTAASAD